LSNGSCGTHRLVALNGRVVLFVNPVVARGMYVIFRSDFGLSGTVQGGDNKSRVAVKVTYSYRGRLRI
jgi:hypothetical protein